MMHSWLFDDCLMDDGDLTMSHFHSSDRAVTVKAMRVSECRLLAHGTPNLSYPVFTRGPQTT